jgi:hypothetical protein
MINDLLVMSRNQAKNALVRQARKRRAQLVRDIGQ